MMKTNNQVIRVAVIACLLFLTGKLIFFKLFALFEPAIADIHFQIIERPHKIPTSILFALLMAVVTVLIALIWLLGPVRSNSRRMGIIGVVIVCMVAGIFVRHQLVKNYFLYKVRPYLLANHQLPMRYPIDPANFVYYMFAGCCIGCIISLLLLREKVSKQ